jgi:hypothetical protein
LHSHALLVPDSEILNDSESRLIIYAESVARFASSTIFYDYYFFVNNGNFDEPERIVDNL